MLEYLCGRCKITLFISVVFVGIAKGLTENGTLLVVRSGGSYDPQVLMNTPLDQLVAVNDCPDDESLPLQDLLTKGTYRSETILNLTQYEDVELEFILYNEHQEEMWRLGPCPYGEPLTCPWGTGDTIQVKPFAGDDGFTLGRDPETLLAIFNPNHYLSTSSTGVKFIVTSPSSMQVVPSPGYKGCHTFPTTTTSQTQMSSPSVDNCFASCDASAYFSLSGTNCSCITATEVNAMTRVEEGNCTELCSDDSIQFCGGTDFESLYDRNKYDSFRTFYLSLNQTSTTATATVNVDSANATKLDMSASAYVSAAKVIEEEECQLTNLYFDVSPTGYNIYVSNDCALDGTLHATLDGNGNLEHFNPIRAKCVTVEPVENNYTFPRANIEIFSRTEPTDVQGIFVIRGKWTIPEPSSSPIESSSTIVGESSSVADMTTSDTMLSTSMADSSSVLDIAPTTTAAAAEATTTDSSGVDSETFIPTAASLTPTATSLDASSNTGVLLPSPTASVTVHTAPNTNTALATTTATASTPSIATPPAPTTKKPIYTKDGRLIYEACTCVCKPHLKPNQTAVQAAIEKGEKLSEDLEVNTKNLSATIRKKTSAEDDRPSATTGGFVAITLLGSIGVAFLVADFLTIVRHFHMLKSNVQSLLSN